MKRNFVFLACLCGFLVAVLTACGPAAGGPVTTEGLTLSWSPDGKWIVFPSSSGGGTPELYVLNVAEALEGAGRESWIHLSSGFANVIGANNLDAITYILLEWSPDGRRIAFSAGDSIYAFETSCLEAPTTCANSLVRMIGGASAWVKLAWSLDGTLLLVESTIAGPMVKMPKGMGADHLVRVMRVVVADGSQKVILSRESEPRQAPDWKESPLFSPSWSPDGKRIVFCSDISGKSELFIITLEGEDVIQFTNTPYVEETSPIWSPDGGRIAYRVGSDSGGDIYSQELDGGEPVCVSCNVHPSWEHRLLWLKWSPDGRQFAYGITGRRVPFQRAIPYYLYLIGLDGSNQITVMKKGFSGPPFWSPDGTRLAFAFRPKPFYKSWEADIFLINADGSGLTNLTD